MKDHNAKLRDAELIAYTDSAKASFIRKPYNGDFYQEAKQELQIYVKSQSMVNHFNGNAGQII